MSSLAARRGVTLPRSKAAEGSAGGLIMEPGAVKQMLGGPDDRSPRIDEDVAFDSSTSLGVTPGRTASLASTVCSEGQDAEGELGCASQKIKEMERIVSRRPTLFERRQVSDFSRQCSRHSGSSDFGRQTSDALSVMDPLSIKTDWGRQTSEEDARHIAANNRLQERFEMKERLGQGCAAVVFRARRFCDSKEVALKIVRTVDEETAMTVKKEYEVLMAVQHPHIIRAYEYCLCNQGAVIALEYIPGSGTLEDAMAEAPNSRLSESVSRELTRSLIQAIEHMHRMRIIHRDIKVQNILVTGNRATGELGDLRLLDFNTASHINNGGGLTMTGTPDYMPPEVLLGEAQDEESDIWAVGLCLHYMICGCLPCKRNKYPSHEAFGMALKARVEVVLAAKCHQLATQEAVALLRRCLKANPMERPSAGAVLMDEWFGTIISM